MKRWIVLPSAKIEHLGTIRCFFRWVKARDYPMSLSNVFRLLREKDETAGTCYSENSALELAGLFEATGIEWSIDEIN